MDFYTSALFSLSVSIGAIAGLLRFRKTEQVFFPFFVLLWAGCTNEILSLVLMHYGFSNVLNYNLFVLAEGVLGCLLFRNWRLLSQKVCLFLLSLAGLLWFFEWLVTPLNSFQSYSIIFTSFLIVLMSISMINRILFSLPYSLLKDPVFLICTGFIMYYTFSVLTETFWMFGIQRSRSFRLSINALLNYINLFSNLLFLLAILWMPTRHRFTMRCS